MTGFAWYFLGIPQHDNLPLIQIADLAGVYGVSFVLAAINGWLFECRVANHFAAAIPGCERIAVARRGW